MVASLYICIYLKEHIQDQQHREMTLLTSGQAGIPQGNAWST